MPRPIIDALESRTLLTTFIVTTVADSGAGSLREAMLDANSNNGADTINFNIASTTRQIRPLSALPQIFEDLTIDGTSQPGYKKKPLIEINGKLAGAATDGLYVTGGALTLKGLSITSFNGGGVHLASNGSILENNYIGIDPSGTIDRGNVKSGIIIDGASDSMIGGYDVTKGNIIAYNGHGSAGVVPGIIMFGGGDGNAVLGNSIFSNHGSGIDIVASGTTPDGVLPGNDPKDADSGTNDLTNKPSFTFVGVTTTQTHAFGTMMGKPNTAYHIELFANPRFNSGSVQGATYVGAGGTVTDSTGAGFYDLYAPTSAGTFYTETATDADNNTSEFCLASAAEGQKVAGTVYLDTNGNGKRDTGEPVLSGVTAFLDYNHNNSPSNQSTATTDNKGHFDFGTLSTGPVRLRVLVPTGGRVTAPAAGYYDFTVPTDKSTDKRLFGITASALISGFVYADSDKDGTKDANENGRSGFTVFIDKDNDGVLDSGEKKTTTDATGAYSFTGLSVGTYVIRVVAKKGFVPTKPKPAVQSLKVSSGQVRSGKNFGFVAA